MAEKDSFEVTLQDIRAIIHGLRMATFSFVEEQALTEIKSMIKALPGPEDLNGLEPGQLKLIQSDVGNIMRLIEIYGKRDMEYKTRYKSRTGLPPRYKVLDWRVDMDKAAKDVTRSMVKTSAIADELGYSSISDRLIRCAKKVQSNELDEFELAKITAETLDKIGLVKEASEIRKVAQNAQVIDVSIDDITGGLQQIYKSIDNVISGIEIKSNELLQLPTAKRAVKALGNLWKQLKQFRGGLEKPIAELERETPAIQQELEQLIPKSVFDANDRKNYTIEWSDPDENGEETAYVTKSDGQRYEVQRESNGKMIVSKTPMNSASAPVEETQNPSTSSGSGIGGGGSTTTLQPPDISNLSGESIQSILNELQKVASSNSYMIRQALDSSIPQEIISYIQSIKGNQVATSEFIKLLNKRKQELGVAALESLDRGTLFTMIQKYVPEVWQKGYGEKGDEDAVGKLSNEKMIEIIKEKVGPLSLPGFIQTVTASRKVFNLKRYSKSK